jgi:hypothetical protein
MPTNGIGTRMSHWLFLVIVAIDLIRAQSPFDGGGFLTDPFLELMAGVTTPANQKSDKSDPACVTNGALAGSIIATLLLSAFIAFLTWMIYLRQKLQGLFSFTLHSFIFCFYREMRLAKILKGHLRWKLFLFHLTELRLYEDQEEKPGRVSPQHDHLTLPSTSNHKQSSKKPQHAYDGLFEKVHCIILLNGEFLLYNRYIRSQWQSITVGCHRL